MDITLLTLMAGQVMGPILGVVGLAALRSERWRYPVAGVLAFGTVAGVLAAAIPLAPYAPIAVFWGVFALVVGVLGAAVVFVFAMAAIVDSGKHAA